MPDAFRHSLSAAPLQGPCQDRLRTSPGWCGARAHLCLLEMDVSVIIGLILKLDPALELSVSFKVGIPPVCIDYRHFQLDKTFPQSPADCGD